MAYALLTYFLAFSVWSVTTNADTCAFREQGCPLAQVCSGLLASNGVSDFAAHSKGYLAAILKMQKELTVEELPFFSAAMNGYVIAPNKRIATILGLEDPYLAVDPTFLDFPLVLKELILAHEARHVVQRLKRKREGKKPLHLIQPMLRSLIEWQWEKEAIAEQWGILQNYEKRSRDLSIQQLILWNGPTEVKNILVVLLESDGLNEQEYNRRCISAQGYTFHRAIDVGVKDTWAEWSFGIFGKQ